MVLNARYCRHVDATIETIIHLGGERDSVLNMFEARAAVTPMVLEGARSLVNCVKSVLDEYDLCSSVLESVIAWRDKVAGVDGEKTLRALVSCDGQSMLVARLDDTPPRESREAQHVTSIMYKALSMTEYAACPNFDLEKILLVDRALLRRPIETYPYGNRETVEVYPLPCGGSLKIVRRGTPGGGCTIVGGLPDIVRCCFPPGRRWVMAISLLDRSVASELMDALWKSYTAWNFTARLMCAGPSETMVLALDCRVESNTCSLSVSIPAFYMGPVFVVRYVLALLAILRCVRQFVDRAGADIIDGRGPLFALARR